MAGTKRTVPAWATMIGDVAGAVAMVWTIPVAILVVGAPIVLLASMVIALARWLL